ncbi:hypothetical protein GOP47_0015877 [Adiantum capillus-veneris]|uniref:Uncharacterized protein n=1 Tax=Adiantum capillus-veneris TaxID=13818 RepID=A0A9D4UKJ8_ADICA|nr:hypothetical protein GOP47_0015877 [Adiantum capillus-veneris]
MMVINATGLEFIVKVKLQAPETEVDSDIECVIAMVDELGITIEMAGTIKQRVLPAVIASRHSAIAEALEILLSPTAVAKD